MSMDNTSTHTAMADASTESMTSNMAQESTSEYVGVKNTPTSKTSDGILVHFMASPTIHKSDLGEIQMNITDAKSGSKLSHVDWAIAVKDPQGNVFYKTTTAHSHVGMMKFSVAFPMAGENTVSVTTSSIGNAMMGLEPTPKGRTHTMISGTLKGFAADPLNDFGSRTFEFPVYVQPEDNVRVLDGNVPNTSIKLEMQSLSNEIVAGQPSTFVFTVTKASNNSMVTHPDLQITAQTYNYTLSQSAQLHSPLAMNGAIHGHTGVETWTPTFPSAGRYVVTVNLQPSSLSNYDWGYASTQFDVFVSQPQNAQVNTTPEQQPDNTVNILGLESPFFSPNTLNVQAGTTVTFVNTDGNSHTVTSVKAGTTEPDGTFDSGIISAGKSFSFKFDKPGTYEYICNIHIHMRGTVNVS
jgi:plastocyanin